MLRLNLKYNYLKMKMHRHWNIIATGDKRHVSEKNHDKEICD